MSKLFVVFGATGQQGGALVNYIISHPDFSKDFRLRGITRNSSSPAAKQLHEKGVEVVELKDGRILFGFAWGPETKLPLIDINDTGKYLSPALRDPIKYNGCRLIAATAFYTAKEQVDTWSTVSGKEVILPEEDIPLLTSDPLQQKMSRPGTVLEKWGYYGPTGEEDLCWMHNQLNEKLTTWKEFLESNGPWFVE
ncbi:hypothetical protein PISL3812_00077 [Talaromyces islandicus]|uniref:Rhodanese domain-containing protein n=1 Tax=Talaromyces islandicus TaxID=28573 RepID=A0A0U1LIU7_TALIS|nr:hypothetical protein PISL3812_00077 [Talaromyces islandicus]